MQQQTVDHAEDDDVGGDGHGEGEDRGEGEAGRPAQLTKRVAKILEERVHGLPSRCKPHQVQDAGHSRLSASG
jgi:hypothetical protein